jgi:hypothetical protein
MYRFLARRPYLYDFNSGPKMARGLSTYYIQIRSPSLAVLDATAYSRSASARPRVESYTTICEPVTSMQSGQTLRATFLMSTRSSRNFSAQIRRVLLAAASALLIGSALLRPVLAQGNPEQILRGVIQQFQTGTPNPTWYGVQLWNLLALQTSNTGISLQLVQLGQVRNVAVNSTVPMPTGILYQMTAQHQNGVSNWVLGISSLTRRIEVLESNFGPTQQPIPVPNLPAQPSAPQDGFPSPSPLPNPTPNPYPSNRDKGSAACQKFPNLC